MKQQIVRLSPHQNAKVFAILMAVGSLVFLVPFFLVAMLLGAGQRPPLLAFVAMPLVYLVIGYLTVVVGCALYNALYASIGGIEFETS